MQRAIADGILLRRNQTLRPLQRGIIAPAFSPFPYLTDILERMVRGHTIDRIDELMPWNYTAREAEAA